MYDTVKNYFDFYELQYNYYKAFMLSLAKGLETNIEENTKGKRK